MPWNKSLSSAVVELEQVTEDDVRLLANSMRNEFQSRTPVGNPSLWAGPAPRDYVGGSLRRSWELEKRNNGWLIFNNQPYAERVWAAGWSTQLAEGAVDILLNDFRIANV